MGNSVDITKQINDTKLMGRSIAIWHLGQESMAVKSSSGVCFFDPYLTNSLHDVYGGHERNFVSPVKPEEITNADYVFISHDHGDHLDPETLVGISRKSPQAKFICPAPIVHHVERLGIDSSRIIPAKSEQVISLGELEVIPVAEMHEDYSTDNEGNHAFLGYIVNMNGIKFYHAGDTVCDLDLVNRLKKYDIEIACLPINGHDWKRLNENLLGNMTFREAVELAHAVGAEMLIPMHYDLFDFNTENPAYFVDYLYRNYPRQKFKMFVPGERMIYISERV